MANEKKTEKIVTDALRQLGYYDDSSIHVEEQQSDSPRIDKLLKTASKKGTGQGYPEFIIHSDQYPDFVVVIECKADPQKHESETRKKYSEFAVDGVLLYSSYLAKDFNVIAIAISGETIREVKVSHFMQLKGQSKEIPIFGEDFLTFANYYNGYNNHQAKFNQDYLGLLKYSEELNTKLHTYKISEADRAFFISGVLIALQDKAFQKSYEFESTAESLCNSLLATIKTQLTNSSIEQKRIDNIESQFLFIRSNVAFNSDKKNLTDLIKEVDRKVNSFMRTYQYFDTLGRFYTEFLRYANNDSGLGIVLTPSHITELFCDLAEVTEDSVILDNCAGTGGFLISGMKRMIELAKGDEVKIANIKKKQIVGVEVKSNIYSLCVTNMIIHGDGKTNIIHDSCFDSILKVGSEYNPTIGFLNPPYKADKKTDTEELEFVLNNLEMLEPNGKCVCIVPMQCALSQSGKILEVKKRLLKEHTLEAVMSMPDQLFYPVGAVTCIMVFTAKRPHPQGKKTWFGYWKEDGYLISKNKRVDSKNLWADIKSTWLDLFVNREVKPGLSVTKEITFSDEWCAEAYMETDYSKLTEEDFLQVLKDYVAYQYLNAGEAHGNG
jgi:type I restriction-modification system DNA methylase subunit